MIADSTIWRYLGDYPEIARAFAAGCGVGLWQGFVLATLFWWMIGLLAARRRR